MRLDMEEKKRQLGSKKNSTKSQDKIPNDFGIDVDEQKIKGGDPLTENEGDAIL